MLPSGGTRTHHLLLDRFLLLGIVLLGEGLDDIALLDPRGACDEDTITSPQPTRDRVVLSIIDGTHSDFGEG